MPFGEWLGPMLKFRRFLFPKSAGSVELEGDRVITLEGGERKITPRLLRLSRYPESDTGLFALDSARNRIIDDGDPETGCPGSSRVHTAGA